MTINPPSSPPAPDRTDVVVVGAGVAGLACALEVCRSGREVVVLEASDGVGGRVRSDRMDGFTLDRGFQVLLTAYPEVQRLLELDQLQLRPFQPGAMVRRRGGFHRVSDPFRRPQDALATLRAPVGSVLDKARIGLLRWRLLRSDPRELLRRPELETSAYLRQLGFSDAFVEQFFRPFFGGVSLDPSLRTSSRMFDVLFRSFAAGDIALPAAGMQAIPDQLAARLPDGCIRLHSPVVAVGDRAVRLADGSTCSADAVVVATDGPTASELTTVARPASCASTTVWFGAGRAPIDEPVLLLDGDGEGPARTVAVMSAVAPEYAPAGAALVAASTPTDAGEGGRQAIAEAMQRQLRGWFGASVDSWTVLRTDVIPHGLPDQSPPLHPKKAVRLRSGVYVCGDHRDTGSLQGALHSGRRAAAQVTIDHAVAAGT